MESIKENQFLSSISYSSFRKVCNRNLILIKKLDKENLSGEEISKLINEEVFISKILIEENNKLENDINRMKSLFSSALIDDVSYIKHSLDNLGIRYEKNLEANCFSIPLIFTLIALLFSLLFNFFIINNLYNALKSFDYKKSFDK